MSISTNNKIGDILREYTRSLTAPKPTGEKIKTTDVKSVENNVIISEEGKKKMRDRFQSDVINYLRTKY